MNAAKRGRNRQSKRILNNDKMRNINLYRSLLLIFIQSLLLIGVAMGQDSEQPLGDHPLMQRFPDSTLEEIEVVDDVSYQLILGSLKRTRGVVRAEESERLRGDVSKLVYQVPQQYSGEEVYSFFRDQAEERGYEVLFECRSRECGSSNYWANDVFRNRILYGPERNQYFMSLRVPRQDRADAHISIYVITRANRRLYFYLEIVEDRVSREVMAVSETDLLESLNESGSVILPSIVFEDDESLADGVDLQAVMELLQSDTDLQVYVVAHLGGEDADGLQSLLARSEARARLVKRELEALGIPGGRIIAAGVGPLAPACTAANCRDRVELVLR